MTEPNCTPQQAEAMRLCTPQQAEDARRRRALTEMVAMDEQMEAEHPGWMTGEATPAPSDHDASQAQGEPTAHDDAEVYGVGFEVDGKRVHPGRVVMRQRATPTPTISAGMVAESERRDTMRRASELLLTLSRITRHRTIDPTVPLAQDMLATAERLARLATDDSYSVEVVRDMDVPRGAFDFIDAVAAKADGPHRRIETPQDAQVIVFWHNERPAAFVLNLRDQFNHSIQFRATTPLAAAPKQAEQQGVEQ